MAPVRWSPPRPAEMEEAPPPPQDAPALLPRRSARSRTVPSWHADYNMESDGSEMSAMEVRRSPVYNNETIGVGGMQEDDIRPAVSGGRISATTSGTSSSGGGEAQRGPDEGKMATRAARVILAVLDMLGERGVNGRFVANVLEGLGVGVDIENFA